MTDNPSGVQGLAGILADAFDRIPVKGLMAVIVTIAGLTVALTNGGLAKGDCAKTPLRHVYNPARLKIVEKCAQVTGTVVAWRHEHDGDYHVSMVMDQLGWTNGENVRGQHGYTVVEFVPLDPKPRFKVGQRLRLRGTKVYDQQHKSKSARYGWIELHPVFAVDDVTPIGPGAPPPTGRNRPGLAPPTEQ